MRQLAKMSDRSFRDNATACCAGHQYFVLLFLTESFVSAWDALGSVLLLLYQVLYMYMFGTADVFHASSTGTGMICATEVLFT